MSNKYYVNKEDFKYLGVASTLCTITTKKSATYDTEVQIKIIEPVYEYQVIYRRKWQSSFALSDLYYLDIEEFFSKGIYNDLIGECELYLPSKRERK